MIPARPHMHGRRHNRGIRSQWHPAADTGEPGSFMTPGSLCTNSAPMAWNVSQLTGTPSCGSRSVSLAGFEGLQCTPRTGSTNQVTGAPNLRSTPEHWKERPCVQFKVQWKQATRLLHILWNNFVAHSFFNQAINCLNLLPGNLL